VGHVLLRRSPEAGLAALGSGALTRSGAVPVCPRAHLKVELFGVVVRVLHRVPPPRWAPRARADSRRVWRWLRTLATPSAVSTLMREETTLASKSSSRRNIPGASSLACSWLYS